VSKGPYRDGEKSFGWKATEVRAEGSPRKNDGRQSGRRDQKANLTSVFGSVCNSTPDGGVTEREVRAKGNRKHAQGKIPKDLGTQGDKMEVNRAESVVSKQFERKKKVIEQPRLVKI